MVTVLFYLRTKAARELEFLVGKRANGSNTFSLGDALGIAQHHDAATGTAKQHTTNDYVKRLSIGVSEVAKYYLSKFVHSDFAFACLWHCYSPCRQYIT